MTDDELTRIAQAADRFGARCKRLAIGEAWQPIAKHLLSLIATVHRLRPRQDDLRLSAAQVRVLRAWAKEDCSAYAEVSFKAAQDMVRALFTDA
jgi:hypothetical protein